jgi:guanylate kinase
LAYSISYTTRSPRGAERDGVEYHFVDERRFEEMERAGEFVESAHVHGNRYGTAASTVAQALTAGQDLLFDIDYQGAFALKARFAEDVVLVFLVPPSMAELERRLRSRGTDDDETIRRRLEMARLEIGHYDRYDYVIVNDQIDSAYEALRSIHLAARQRVVRMKDTVASLLRFAPSAGGAVSE